MSLGLVYVFPFSTEIAITDWHVGRTVQFNAYVIIDLRCCCCCTVELLTRDGDWPKPIWRRQRRRRRFPRWEPRDKISVSTSFRQRKVRISGLFFWYFWLAIYRSMSLLSLWRFRHQYGWIVVFTLSHLYSPPYIPEIRQKSLLEIKSAYVGFEISDCRQFAIFY